MRLIAASLAALVLFAAERPTVKTLMDLDEQFCRDFTARGADGWLAWFAEDAVFFNPQGPYSRSKADLERHYRKMFGGRKGGLTWTPIGGEISASGDLGFTYGTFVAESKDKDGKPVKRTGKYQTTWKRQKDGSWKIVADLGTPDTPPKNP